MSTPAVRILSSQPGRFRAGRRHPADTTHPAGTFTQEELSALEADPVITVLPLDEPADGKTSPSELPGGGSGSGEKGEGASFDAPSPDRNTPEGRSGTAREAPSTGSGTSAATPNVGTQSAAPNDTGNGSQGPAEAGKAQDAAAAAASSPPKSTRTRAPRAAKAGS